MHRIRNTLITSLQQLRWKLTFRYTVITLTAFFIAAIVFLLSLSNFVNERARLTPDELVAMLNSTYVPLVSGYLSTDPPDIRALQSFLEERDSLIINVDPIRIGEYVIELSSTNILSVLFLSADGMLIGSLPHDLVKETAIGERLRVD